MSLAPHGHPVAPPLVEGGEFVKTPYLLILPWLFAQTSDHIGQIPTVLTKINIFKSEWFWKADINMSKYLVRRELCLIKIALLSLTLIIIPAHCSRRWLSEKWRWSSQRVLGMRACYASLHEGGKKKKSGTPLAYSLDKQQPESRKTKFALAEQNDTRVHPVCCGAACTYQGHRFWYHPSKNYTVSDYSVWR